MFPYAAAHNLRLVSITAPGYPGSSPLTDAQAAALTCENFEGIAGAVFEVSRAIALGIVHLIRTERLPPPTAAGGLRSGGVRLHGWSAGNVFLFSLLANLDSLAKDASALLERYISLIDVYGKSSFTFPRLLQLNTV